MIDRFDDELLLDYLEGELDSERRAELEKALAQDPQLASLLSAMSGDRDLLRSLPKEQAPSDLVHDATQSLERGMLLDDMPAVDDGPIPISRGRGLAHPPADNTRWGRVIGLTGLAAAVAVAAGVFVIMNPGNDPLQQTADRFKSGDDDQTPPINTPSTLSQEGDDDKVGKLRAKKKDGGEKAPDTKIDKTDNRLATKSSDDKNERAFRLTGDPNAGLKEQADNDNGADQSPQRPFALASRRPTQQLVLVSDNQADNKLTFSSVVAYCLDNGIPIVQTPKPTPNDNDPARRQGAQLVYTLVITPAQLDALKLAINKGEQFTKNQPAALVASAVGNRNELDLHAIAEQASNRVAKDEANKAVGEADVVDAAAGQVDEPGASAPTKLYMPDRLASQQERERNATNLQRAVARNAATFRLIADKADAQPADKEPLDKGTAANDADDSKAHDIKKSAAPVKRDTPEAKPTKKTEDKDLKDAKPRSPKAKDDAATPETQQAAPPRGGDLDSHLPLADTTSLESLRNRTAEKAPLLVPIAFTTANAELIGKLRAAQLPQPTDPDNGNVPPRYRHTGSKRHPRAASKRSRAR